MIVWLCITILQENILDWWFRLLAKTFSMLKINLFPNLPHPPLCSRVSYFCISLGLTGIFARLCWNFNWLWMESFWINSNKFKSLLLKSIVMTQSYCLKRIGGKLRLTPHSATRLTKISLSILIKISLWHKFQLNSSHGVIARRP